MTAENEIDYIEKFDSFKDKIMFVKSGVFLFKYISAEIVPASQRTVLKRTFWRRTKAVIEEVPRFLRITVLKSGNVKKDIFSTIDLAHDHQIENWFSIFTECSKDYLDLKREMSNISINVNDSMSRFL